MKIGLIGSGNIGTAVAQLAIAQGHDVALSNSRGPDTLADLVTQLGPHASAATATEAAADGDIVVVTIPFKAYQQVPVEPLAGKVVIDTNNYYPQRDGHVAELADDSTSSAELLAAHLPTSRVVKAFNHIESSQLRDQGQRAGAPGRRALAIAGDDAEAKSIVTDLIDSFGFDVVDAGSLADGRRFQVGTPAYGPRLDVAKMRAALG
ncbi:MAG: NADPH-dependent F420 reductase [Jatrophihabitans sp.]